MRFPYISNAERPLSSPGDFAPGDLIRNRSRDRHRLGLCVLLDNSPDWGVLWFDTTTVETIQSKQQFVRSI